MPRLGPLVALVAMLLTAGAPTDVVAATGARETLCPSHGASFALTAPAGWVLDPAAGLSDGPCLVLYREGGSWGGSDVVMYANTASKSVKGNETVERVIEIDIARFQEHSPALVVERSEDPLTTGGKRVVVHRFLGDRWNNLEIVAYIDEPTAVNLIVLSSHVEEGFAAVIPVFEAFVRSYTYVPESDRRAYLRARADADLGERGGKAYETAATQYFVSTHAASLRDCTDTWKISDEPARFDLVIVISPDGLPLVSLGKSTALAICFARTLRGGRFPKPPFAPFHLHIDWTITP